MEIIYLADPDSPRSTAGVAFLINKSLIAPKEVCVHELIPGRALLIRVKWLDSEETKLLNIYAPTDRQIHPAFWRRIQEKQRERRLPRPDFMLGDFNVTEDDIDRAPAKPDNRLAVEALRDLRFAWEIQDEWRHTHPHERAFTYRARANNQDIKSRLDRIPN
jgi:exonuclease III